MKPLLKVFIQNEAGSRIKNKHNERTLEHLGSRELSGPYPYAYGFILDTTTDDGDCVDCFVFTQEAIDSNAVIECHPIGLLEVFENGETDHKVIATLPDEHFQTLEEALDSIRRFYEGETFKVGNFLSVDAAMEFIERSKDR